MAIELGGLDEAHDRGGAFAGAQATGEEPILAAERDGPDTVLDPVVVDWHLTIVEIMNQGRPAFETVIDRFCRRRTIGYLLPSPLEPRFEFIEDWSGLLVCGTICRGGSPRIAEW